MHALLDHLRHVGFGYAPQPLGVDADGREILSYIPGWSPGARPWPPEVWRDELLEQVGQVIRSYHDAVRSFSPGPGAVWHFETRAPGPVEVICHNDVGPTNVVLDGNGDIVGVIDWDDAGPGDPLDDLAHAAWWWVPFVDPGLAARLGSPASTDVNSRLECLARAYGCSDVSAILERLPKLIASRLDRATAGVHGNNPAALALAERGYLDDLAATLDYVLRRGTGKR